MGRAIRPTTIVVVEDEADLRSLAATLFEEAELKVCEFERADEAWEFTKSRPEEVAILFTDVNTPGELDGLTLGQRCATYNPWIRVIVTSGRQPSRTPGGAVTFLQKPWRPLDLLRVAEYGPMQRV